MNSTQFSYFILSGYIDIGLLRYLYFIILLVIYCSVLCSNVLLIAVICVNRSLHEPMYMFLCSLFVNELYGSTGLFPFLLLQILSDIHTVPVPFCFLQILFLYSYANMEFFTLAIMSYDRYLAICHPLEYNTRMTSKKVLTFIVLSWVLAVAEVLVLISLSARLQLCGNVINKVYCDNFVIVRLACSDTSVNNIYGIFYMFTTIFGLIVLILYTYIRILKVCFCGSKQTRQKAVSTCTPHLASLLNFSCGCFFEVMQSRFNMKRLPHVLRIILSLYFLVCQPLFNPVLYGLNLTKIRLICKTLFLPKL